VTGQFRRSSAVEQLTVNQLVVGSIPTAGANFPITVRISLDLARFVRRDSDRRGDIL
jgi:hypothetical protein